MIGTKLVRHGLMAAMVTALLFPAMAAEAQEAQWFHVRVEEPESTRVSLNLPLGLVELGLEIADRHVMRDEQMRWGSDGKVGVVDLRRMWVELQAAGDVDLVEIFDGEAHVQISRRGDRVILRIDEGTDTRVRFEMPSHVVDALLGGDGERLDLRGAVQELARSGRQDLLDIQDGETTVRIWIDENSGSDDES